MAATTSSAGVPGAPAPAIHLYHRVYVWELPVRFYHWLNALCILVLTVTGILIAHPPVLMSGSEAWQSYWFGTTRFIHFVTAYVFFFNFAFRIYWGFVGNDYANWKHFLPINPKQFRQVRDVLRVDILQAQSANLNAIGHNALAYLTYFGMFLVFLFQVVTGFAMYASMSDFWFPKLFVWAVPIFGGDYQLREWHYLAMWFFIVFTIVHVYLVFYHDYVEGHGVMSSMVGGWKFLARGANGNGASEGKSFLPTPPPGHPPRTERKS